jgi:hypothetical protein
MGLVLALAALAACGIKGDPAPPQAEEQGEAS